MDNLNLVLSVLACITSLACTVLLFRAYVQRRVRLLLWSALCFVGLTVSNLVLIFDLVIFPAVELRPLRSIAALIGMLFLLYAFIWESD
jgi:hypothetical protein